MKIGKAGDARYFFVETIVVLHLAGAERIHPLTDRVIPRRDAREMTNYVDFCDFGHAGQFIVALKLGRYYFVEWRLINIERRKTETHTPRLRAIKNKPLVWAEVSCDLCNS